MMRQGFGRRTRDAAQSHAHETRHPAIPAPAEPCHAPSPEDGVLSHDASQPHVADSLLRVEDFPPTPASPEDPRTDDRAPSVSGEPPPAGAAVTSPSAGTGLPPADEREARRRRVLKAGLICFNARHSTLPCTVRDLSEDGARIMVSGSVSIPDSFELFIELDGSWADCAVAWRTGNTAGVRFAAPLKVERPSRSQVLQPIRPAEKPSLRRRK